MLYNKFYSAIKYSMNIIIAQAYSIPITCTRTLSLAQLSQKRRHILIIQWSFQYSPGQAKEPQVARLSNIALLGISDYQIPDTRIYNQNPDGTRRHKASERAKAQQGKPSSLNRRNHPHIERAKFGFLRNPPSAQCSMAQ